MNLRSTIFISFFCSCVIISTATAQIAPTSNIYGNDEQPGYRLHLEILSQLNKHDKAAINNVIADSLKDSNSLLTSKAKMAVAANLELANNFYDYLTQTNSLIEATKYLLEAKPEMATDIIALGIALYPDFIQQMYNGASLTGVFEDDDLPIVFLEAGATRADLIDGVQTSPTAREIPPIGSGIGAGGTGGGDATVSTN